MEVTPNLEVLQQLNLDVNLLIRRKITLNDSNEVFGQNRSYFDTYSPSSWLNPYKNIFFFHFHLCKNELSFKRSWNSLIRMLNSKLGGKYILLHHIHILIRRLTSKLGGCCLLLNAWMNFHKI